MKVYFVFFDSISPGKRGNFLFSGWQNRVSKEFKKYHPEIEVHVVQPERLLAKEYHFTDELLIHHHLFPALPLLFGHDLSLGLLSFVRKAAREKCIIILFEYHTLQNLFIARFLKGNSKLIGQQLGGLPFEIKAQYRRDWGALNRAFAKFASGFELAWLKKIDYFITNSSAEKEWLVSRIRAAPKNIEIVQMGVDFERNTPPNDKHEAKAKLGLDPKKKHVMCYGGVGKGSLVLLEAVGKINDPNTVAMLVDPDSQTEKTAGALGSRAVVFKSVSNMPDCIRAADLLVSLWEGVVPGKCWHGIGLVLAEAMACNIPVIANTLGDYDLLSGKKPYLGPEFYFSGTDSNLLASKIGEILSKPGKNPYPALREKMLLFHDWEKKADNLAEVCKHLLG
ncbi:glycosyltransferase family 4 protein [Candidatus Parvarchaeota archaeon]|nr:glycosyltransferase family 4 protein [Candidatus Parvarchaeota archaeon]